MRQPRCVALSGPPQVLQLVRGGQGDAGEEADEAEQVGHIGVSDWAAWAPVARLERVWHFVARCELVSACPCCAIAAP